MWFIKVSQYDDLYPFLSKRLSLLRISLIGLILFGNS